MGHKFAAEGFAAANVHADNQPESKYPLILTITCRMLSSYLHNNTPLTSLRLPAVQTHVVPAANQDPCQSSLVNLSDGHLKRKGNHYYLFNVVLVAARN